jgi:tetratricopeptide (TPR) repeat protein
VVALNNRAVAFLDAGDLYMARRLLEKAASLKPGAEEVQNNLATVLWRQGHFEPALVIFHDLAHRHEDMVEPYYNVARIWAARQEYDSALAYYDSVLTRDSTYVEAMNNKGSIYRERGDDEAARLHWIEALRMRPEYSIAGQNLVRSLLEAGQADSAVQVLEAAQPPWRHSVAWYHLFVRVALARADSTRARVMIGEALQRYPDDRATRSLARSLGL